MVIIIAANRKTVEGAEFRRKVQIRQDSRTRRLRRGQCNTARNPTSFTPGRPIERRPLPWVREISAGSSETISRMERAFVKSALRQIRTLYTLGALGGLTDAQLLELFLSGSRDTAEDAFSALVDRHGPMVLGVCQRMLQSTHDAEDAFQAAFFILARRAASIGRREKLAGWLHGVAVRTASETRRRTTRERTRERRLMEVSRRRNIARGRSGRSAPAPR